MADDADDAGEEIISDDPQGGAPPEPPDPDEPRFVPTEELQARAAAFDEATFGTAPEGEAPEGEAPDPGADPVAPTPSGAADTVTQQLLRQNAELLEAVKSLAQRPGQGADIEDPLATARAASPEIQQLDEAISSTEANTQALSKANQQIYSQLGNLEANVLILQGKLEATPPEDRWQLQQEHAQAIAVRDRALVQMQQNQQATNNNNAQLSAWKRERDAAVRDLSRSVEEKREQFKQDEADKVATVTEYDGAFREEAKAYGIDPKSTAFGVLHRQIKADIYAFVSTRPPNEPGVDIGGAVKHLFKQVAQAYNLGERKTLAASSQARLANRSGIAPKGTRLPALTIGAFPRRPSLLEVRARRDAILGVKQG